MPADATPSPAQPMPRLSVSPLQQAWLRELGVEKLWVPRAAQAQGGRTGGRTGAGQADRAAHARDGHAAAGTPVEGVPAADRLPAAQPAGAPPARDTGAPAAAAGGPSRQAQEALQVLQQGRRAQRPRAAAPAAAQAQAQAQGAAAGFGALREDRRAAVAGMDFDTLRQEVVGCRECGLCEGRRQAVFGTGAQPAAWLVVGEAPGEQEDRQGLPFVGRSGQLLDAMLAALGHSRQQDVYIANVIKCRPPGNRNPKPEEIAACSPYLMRQIELLRPQRILVLGRFAAQTLLQTEASIGSLRGRVHTLRGTDGQDIPMVVSYHPAYLLRSPHEKARAWQDLRLAATL